ncbi:MAG: hypothetical protein OXB88_02510 [Bacteriovoracales bacterium]|nr:hypothetical protein [Bacteriovoracales bacterium]
MKGLWVFFFFLAAQGLGFSAPPPQNPPGGKPPTHSTHSKDHAALRVAFQEGLKAIENVERAQDFGSPSLMDKDFSAFFEKNLSAYGPSDPARRLGIIQEVYLTMLTAFIRGATMEGRIGPLPEPHDNMVILAPKKTTPVMMQGNLKMQGVDISLEEVEKWMRKNPVRRIWDLKGSYLAGEIEERGGAWYFMEFLKKTPLDVGGIVRLKAFLSSYRGLGQEEAPLFKEMMRALEEKEPTTFTYSDYDYKSVYRGGRPSFSYQKFDILPERVERKAQDAVREFVRKEKSMSPEELVRKERARLTKVLETKLPSAMSKAFLKDIPGLIEEHIAPALSSHPEDHPVRREGIIQELYLTALTDILRGGKKGYSVPLQGGVRTGFAHSKDDLRRFGVTPDMMNHPQAKMQIGLREDYAWDLESSYQGNVGLPPAKPGGADMFLTLLHEAPLDEQGLSLLKAHLLAYEGLGEKEMETFERLLKAVDEKKPIAPYNDYEYKSVRRGEGRFAYDSFDFDPDKKELVRAQDISDRRVRGFPELMQKGIKGKARLIEKIDVLVKQNSVNPQKFVTITLLGTTGNGKTELAYVLAETLFGSRDAAYAITFNGNVGELNSYLRSETGYVGSNEPTGFETWLVDRVKKDQGGVIILDELLSLHGLSERQIGERLASLSRLYDLLYVRRLKIGSETYDVSKFHVVITGNLFQELFMGLDDTPDAEKIVENIVSKLTTTDIVKGFGAHGIDAPKVARFGLIDIDGPLKKIIAREVARLQFDRQMKEMKGRYKDLEVVVPDELLVEITNRLSTVELGMRMVEKGIDRVVTGPIAGILFDRGESGSGPKKIEVKLEGDKIAWYADGEEVVYVSREINEASGLRSGSWKLKARALKEIEEGKVKVETPAFKDLDLPQRKTLSPEELFITRLHETEGHWAVGTILEGKNESAAISLIPSESSLGYVRHKDQGEIVKHKNISTLLKRIAVLEAGYRAPIVLEGLYATGAGWLREKDRKEKKDKKPGNSDMEKIESNIDKGIINNQLLSEITEYGVDEKEINLLRRVLADLGREVADEVVLLGKSVGFGDEAGEELMKTRYLSEEQLDRYAENALKKLDMDPDMAFTLALEKAAKTLMARYGLKKLKMLKIATTRVLEDVISIRKIQNLEVSESSPAAGRPGILDELSKQSKKIKQSFVGSSCKALLRKLRPSFRD